MNRRLFLRALTTSMGAAWIGTPRAAYAQPPGNPKVNFFGMMLISDAGGQVMVRVPRLDGMDQHRAFITAPAASIATWGGPHVTAGGAGLQLLHRDYSTQECPDAMCLDQHVFTVSGGTAPAVVQQSLLQRLPSLSALGTQAGGASRALAMPKGSFDIALSGGQLRPPMRASTSPGSDPAVTWQITVNGASVGGPMRLTDLSVFESDTPTLALTIGGKTVTLSPGQTIWVFNLPMFKAEDKTPREIEHIAEWTLLLNPAPASAVFKATTTFPIVFSPSRSQFSHPCLTRPGVRAAALAYFQARHPGFVAKAIPPDSDVCMQFRD